MVRCMYTNYLGRATFEKICFKTSHLPSNVPIRVLTGWLSLIRFPAYRSANASKGESLRVIRILLRIYITV